MQSPGGIGGRRVANGHSAATVLNRTAGSFLFLLGKKLDKPRIAANAVEVALL
jgi:hypothetical protein